MRLCLAAALLLLATLAGAAPAVLYVGPNGNDAWSGALAAPNATGTDGPLATPAGARDALRGLRRAGKRAEGATVFLREGLYCLPETFTLEPQDSGEPGAPVIYAAFEGEQPTISGGTVVTGWQVQDGRWTVTLPDAAEGRRFSHLFVNGERRFRPRLPEEGFYFVSGSAPTSGNNGDKPDRFRFRRGDIDPNWANLTDVEVHAFHIWSTARLPIASVEAGPRVVNLAGATWHAGLFPLNPPAPYGGRYILENVKEALDKPGEFYLDQPTGTLTYIPLPGETPENTQVIAPRLDRVLELKGYVAALGWVHDVAFRGLTFAHGNWTVPATGWSQPQADVGMQAAVRLEGARDCSLDACRVTRCDGYGLELAAGCKRDTIDGCEFTDLGGGGVKIGPGGGAEEALASDDAVRDCLIAHVGRMHPAAVGIWIGYGHHITVEHCTIHDLYYSGISCGWSWGYDPTPNHHNVLADNLIYDTPQQVLGDMGGIYTLGLQPDSAMRGNVIHDQDGRPWGVGIYLDEGSSGWTVENNLVYNSSTHVYHTNYGRGNVARNNVFAFGGATTLGRNRREDHGQDVFEHNIVAWREGTLMGAWDGSGKFDYNLYWPAAGQDFDFIGMSLEQWRATGQDVHSVIADPRFTDADNGDFTLRAGSPARQIGFVPFDVTGAGRRRQITADDKPFPRVFAPMPLEIPPSPVFQDYEAVPVGEKDDLGQSYQDSEEGVARVTDETAAEGLHSLRFTDADTANFWNPHLCYIVNYDTGTLASSFDIRLEPGAYFEHAWRDAANPFRTGPSMRFGPGGRLVADGRELTVLPEGQWVHVEVTCALGDAADGRWRLRVTLPGGEVQEFADLSCNPEFRELRWLGFVSVAAGPSVTYLDNVKLEPVPSP